MSNDLTPTAWEELALPGRKVASLSQMGHPGFFVFLNLCRLLCFGGGEKGGAGMEMKKL